MTTLALSVVIPAYNAARLIHRQLDELSRQQAMLAERSNWELLVADNGSTDGTGLLARGYAVDLPLTVIDASARRGPAAARNIGAGAARGDVLVFTDADDVVSGQWLATWMEWCASTTRSSFAAGPIRFDAPTDGPARGNCRVPHHMGLPFASGNNLGCTRELFQELGGFEETRWTGEDIDLSWRALRAGTEIDCVPAPLHVANERNALQLLRRYYEYGLGDPALFRDHRVLSPERGSWMATCKSYLGLLARLPLLWNPEQRAGWAHQCGRRGGRLVGSVRARVWFP